MEGAAIREGCAAFIPTIWLSKVEMVQVVVMMFATCWTSYSTKVYYNSNTHVVCNPKNATVARQCWQNYQENTDPNTFPYWAFVVLQSFVYASPWMVFWIFQKEQAKHLSNRVSALHQDNHEEVNVLVTDHDNKGFFRWQNIMAVVRIVFLISIIVVHVVFFNIGHISCRIESIILKCKVPSIRAPFIGIYVANGFLFLLVIAEALDRIRFWKWICEDRIVRKTYQDTLWFSYACEKNDFMTTWRIIAVPEPPRDCSLVLLDAQSVKLQWEMEINSNVTSYKIEQRVALDGMWELVCEVEERVATVFNLNPFKTYYFRVRAANNNGESRASNSLTVFRCPSSPKMKICFALQKYSVYLKWKRPTYAGDSNIEEYNVQWKLQGERFWSSKDVVTVNAIVDGLKANMFYLFRVRARTRRGYGEWSDIMGEKTLENKDHATDCQPLLLDSKSPVPVESEVLCVQITPLSFNVHVCILRKFCRIVRGRFMEVQWKHKEDKYWQAEERVCPEFTINFLRCRSNYYFRARIEIQPDYYGSWSNIIEVTTLDPPPEPVEYYRSREKKRRCCAIS